jgi:hypothetical protein
MYVDDVASTIWQGLADIARHVIGCHLTQETRIQNVLDDVASETCQALGNGTSIMITISVCGAYFTAASYYGSMLGSVLSFASVAPFLGGAVALTAGAVLVQNG